MTSAKAFLAILCGLLAFTTAVAADPKPFPIGCAVVLCAQGTTCIETKRGPKCVPIISKPPCLCPLVFKPVCCKTPTGLKTTSNSCFCKCGPKNRVISKEPCRTCKTVRCRLGYRCIETPRGPRCVRIACRCTREFKPVCCKLPNGRTVTKNNPCLCTTCIPGAKIVSKGRCPPPITIPPPGLCICPAIFDPVCCKVKGNPVFTAGNKCQCKCRNGKVIAKGTCKSA